VKETCQWSVMHCPGETTSATITTTVRLGHQPDGGRSSGSQSITVEIIILCAIIQFVMASDLCIDSGPSVQL
jgi:hypothetical protein